MGAGEDRERPSGHHPPRRRHHRHRRKRYRWLIAAGAAALAAGAVLAGEHVVRKYREKQAVEAQLAQSAKDWEAKQGQEGDGFLEFEGKRYRRRSDVYPILLLGIDVPGELEETSAAGSAGQSDGIFLAAYDASADTAKLIMIPRDTMTEITLYDVRGNELGKDVQHLTLAFAYGSSPEESCGLAAEAVSGLLGGLPVREYGAVSVGVMPVLNDSVGGVTVTVPNDSLLSKNPEWTKGTELTLYGEEAEAFVRYRDTGVADTAISRMERQEEYMLGWAEAAGEKIREDDGWLPGLFEELEGYAVTNMPKDEYLKVGMALIRSMEQGGEDVILTLPGETRQGSAYDEFYPDEEELTRMVAGLFYKEAR